MALKSFEWPKKITVDRKIVQTLSGATYDNFPKSLKEIIINSYDAFSTNVNITIDQESEKITIEDNGSGMNADDFDFYIRIAGSTRDKSSSLNRRYNRPKVGKFGVGFLSTFPFFKNFYIESKKSGSPEYLYANIPCSNYFDVENNFIDVSDIPISGGIKSNISLVDNHYTRIVLSGFTRLSIAFFNEEYAIKGLRNTIMRYNPIQRLSWDLSEDLPIEYRRSDLKLSMAPIAEELPFEVTINNHKLYREVYGETILETQKGDYEEIGDIKFKYFIVTNHSPINPVEARYLKIRNLNVGVGARETFGIGLEGKVYGKLAWLTGEILVFDGLNDFIAVSRDKFNYSPEYEDFKEFFRARLRFWSNNLDELSKLQRNIDDRGDLEAIKSIDSIKSNTIEKQIKHLENKGYVITTESPSNNSSLSQIQINKEHKEIIIQGNLKDVKKRLEIDSHTYYLDEGNWDYKSEFFPACRLENDNLVINTNYPLFNLKIFDSMLKFQLILTKNNIEGYLDDSSFTKIQDDLIKTFLSNI